MNTVSGNRYNIYNYILFIIYVYNFRIAFAYLILAAGPKLWRYGFQTVSYFWDKQPAKHFSRGVFRVRSTRCFVIIEPAEIYFRAKFLSSEEIARVVPSKVSRYLKLVN